MKNPYGIDLEHGRYAVSVRGVINEMRFQYATGAMMWAYTFIRPFTDDYQWEVVR